MSSESLRVSPVNGHSAKPHLPHTSYVARGRSARKRTSAFTYLKRALLNPCHLLILVLATTIGSSVGSVMVAVIVLAVAEALMMSTLPNVPAFRRYVDRQLEQVERAAAARERSALLLQMGHEYRDGLERLESIIDRIRDAVSPHGNAIGEWLDLGRLTASYVRLAIAHEKGRACLATTHRPGLDDEIHVLEALRRSGSERTRALMDQRVAIARRRADRWDRSQDDLRAIEHQLAMIGELVHLRYEQWAAPVDPQTARDEIGAMLHNLEVNEGSIRELAEYFTVDCDIEPDVLEMGRRSTFEPSLPAPPPQTIRVGPIESTHAVSSSIEANSLLAELGNERRMGGGHV